MTFAIADKSLNALAAQVHLFERIFSMKKRLIAVVASATMLTSVQVAQAEEATPGTPGEFASHIGEIVNRTQKYPNWNHGTECPRFQGLLRNRSRAAAGRDHR